MTSFSRVITLSRARPTLIERARTAFAQNASLLKGSGVMALGAGFTSIFGFFYWWFAARVFPPETIGIASAIISLISVVGLVGDGGLGTLMIGEIARWPKRKTGLIAAALLTSTSICTVLGIASLPLSGFVMPERPSLLTAIVLVLGCGFTGTYIIMDQAFAGMQQFTVRMLRNLACSILRVGSLVTFSIWSTSGLTILVSWIGSLGLSLAFGEVLRHRYRQSFLHRPDFHLLWTLRIRAADHYMLDLGMMVPSFVMPYAVTVLISATSNAPFTVIWLVIGAGSLVPSALATVLFSLVRAEPEQYREKMLVSLIAGLSFSVIFAFVLWISSSEILAVFNPRYLEIEDVSFLSLLGFGLIGCVVRYHVAAAARLGDRMRQMSVWVLLAGVFEVAGASVGSLYGGLAGLCIGYTITTAIEGIVMWTFANPLVSHRWIRV